jgi:hypothetical protein
MVPGLALPFAARLLDNPPEVMAVPARLSTPHCNKKAIRAVECEQTGQEKRDFQFSQQVPAH